MANPILKMSALLMVLVLVPGVSAQVYKWVDENGKVHYSDKPIGPDAKKLELKHEISQSQQAEARQRQQALIRMQQKRVNNELEQAYDEKKAQVDAENEAQQLAHACAQTRRNLKIMQYQAPVYETNEKGERRFIEDAERQKQITELKSLLAQHCQSK